MYGFIRQRALAALLPIFLFCAAPVRSHAIGPKADISFGYSRLGNNAFAPGAGALNGWEGALNGKIRRFVGIELDVAHYGIGAPASTPRSTVVLGGPRLTLGSMGIHVFAHALAGGEHSANNSGFSQSAFVGALGGGGDVRIFPMLALRVSADRLAASSDAPQGANRMRFTTGLIFRF